MAKRRKHRKHKKKPRKIKKLKKFKGGHATDYQKEQCRKHYGNSCYICYAKHRPPIHPLQIHHIQKRANGGGTERSNLVPLCNHCHQVVHKVRPLESIDEDLRGAIKRLISLL